jgi:PAS domain S-box-containing protein
LFNLSAELIFGYKAIEVIGKPMDILLPPSMVEIHRNILTHLLISAKTTIPVRESKEFWGRCKDGTIFPCQVSLSKIHHIDKVIFVAFIMAYTARKSVKPDQKEHIERVFAESEMKQKNTNC